MKELISSGSIDMNCGGPSKQADGTFCCRSICT